MRRLIALNQEAHSLSRKLRAYRQELRAGIVPIEEAVKSNWGPWHERHPNFPMLPLYLAAVSPTGIVTRARRMAEEVLLLCDLEVWRDRYEALDQWVPDDLKQAIAEFQTHLDYVETYVDLPGHVSNTLLPDWYVWLTPDEQDRFVEEMSAYWQRRDLAAIATRVAWWRQQAELPPIENERLKTAP